MEFRVFRHTHKGQVLRPVVKTVAVDVVDQMAFGDRAIRRLPDNVMLQTLPTINLHDSVARLCHEAFGFVLTMVRTPFELIRAGSATKALGRVATVYARVLWAFAGDSLSAKFGSVESNTFSEEFRVGKPPCSIPFQAFLFIPMVIPLGALSVTRRVLFRRKQLAGGQVARSAPDTLTALATIRAWPPIVAFSRYQSGVTNCIRGLLGVLFHPSYYTTHHGQLSLKVWRMLAQVWQSWLCLAVQAKNAAIASSAETFSLVIKSSQCFCWASYLSVPISALHLSPNVSIGERSASQALSDQIVPGVN